MIDGFTRGFPLGIDPDKRPQPRGPCENSDAAKEKPEIVRELVEKELKLHHMLGPFDEPPLPDMVFSPLHLVPKAGSENKYRLIHNLAFPYNEESVNCSIPLEESSVQYHYIGELIEMAIRPGKDIWGCRVDFSHAFRNLAVILADLPLLGFTLDGKYFLNSSVPFGAASSCLIFERVATVLQWIVTSETGWKWISHYLDDFPMLARMHQGLQEQIEKYLALMKRICMPVAEDKTLGPTQLLEYLGLLLNLLNLTLQIPEDKRVKNIKKIDTIISAFRERKNITCKEIQEVTGSLNFICAAIPAGKVFIADLYKLLRAPDGSKRKQGHHRRITWSVYKDMLVFCTFLVECSQERFRSIPFLIKDKRFNEEIQLFADAAGARELGFGCIYGSRWAFGRWSDTKLFHCITPNIALLELLAIVMATELWAKHLQGQAIVLRSDNTATVASINSMKSVIPEAQELLKHMSLNCLHNQIFFKAVHIQGSEFGEADVSLMSTKISSQEFDENWHNSPFPIGQKNKKPDFEEVDPTEQEVISAANSKEFVLHSLKVMGLDDEDIHSFTARMGAKGYSALANFHVACEHFNLPLAWGPRQVTAFLIFVNYKYYTASYVARMWGSIKSLGKLLLQPITSEQEADFELVFQQANEIKDNKVPVSKKLLAQLCVAADEVFAEYNAALAKAMFLTAWGAICESASILERQTRMVTNTISRRMP